MLEKIYQFWNIQDHNIHSPEFTGYEPVYTDFDRFTKSDYE